MSARWAAENHYRMLGTSVCIRAETVAVARAVDRLLTPFRCPPGAKGVIAYSLTSSGVTRDGAPILAGTSWPALLHGLLGDLNAVAVQGFHGLAVHAGVVARRGVAVAWPAASEAGKSTLTAACLSAGFEYVSDEALCVDFDSAAVVAYPKPLKLSRHAAALVGLSWPESDEDMVALLPEDLGASRAAGALRLGHVVQLVRRPGPPVLHPRERSETVATMLTMSFNHFRNPLACFMMASRLATESRAWRLEYDEPEPAAALLCELP